MGPLANGESLARAVRNLPNSDVAIAVEHSIAINPGLTDAVHGDVVRGRNVANRGDRVARSITRLRWPDALDLIGWAKEFRDAGHACGVVGMLDRQFKVDRAVDGVLLDLRQHDRRPAPTRPRIDAGV